MTRRAPNKGITFRPAPYEDIQCNAYLGRHRHNPQPDEIPECQCQPLTQGGTGCAAECHNRYTNHECNPAYCPCGHNCRNQQIQRHQGAKTRLQHMGNKGWGLVAAQPVAAGSFVIEYIGEVLSPNQAARRVERYDAEGQQHTYFMNISLSEQGILCSANDIIDATKRGNRARFINHSCEPNCETQKWVVNGETCVCIFALRDILPGEELTYHYHLMWHGGRRVRCQCGTVQCEGYLGANPTDTLLTAEDDGMFAEVDDCLEACGSDDQLEPEQAGLTACGMFTLSNGVLRQAPTVSGLPSADKVHSPDSSATVTGEPCSDASDLTSSHHGQLHMQKQHKRIRLNPSEGAQQSAQQPVHQHPHGSTAGHNIDSFAALQPAHHCQPSCEPAQHQLPGEQSHEDRAPGFQKHSQHSRHPHCYGQQSFCTASERLAPCYAPYPIPGLTASQQAVKDHEDLEMAQALRQQQNVFKVGYEVDEFGALQVPQRPQPRTVPLKFVFAQRWQQQQQQAPPAVQLSLQQLLLDDAVPLQAQQPSCLAMPEPMQGCQPTGGLLSEVDWHVSAPAATVKLPMRFQLSQAKQAMRKAESGSPNLPCNVLDSSQPSQAYSCKHAAWQLQQLANSSTVNEPFLEQYIDKQNEVFDSLYWSMLESLSAFT